MNEKSDDYKWSEETNKRLGKMFSDAREIGRKIGLSEKFLAWIIHESETRS